MDIKAKEECKINEVEFKVYKPIEVWKCESIDDAIERCEKNKDRDCWVYLEIKCDRYIREDEIKKMKEIKKDILEIIIFQMSIGKIYQLLFGNFTHPVE